MHHSFRYGGFRCFKALSGRPKSVISVDLLHHEKTAQHVRPSENRRHAILPRLLLVKESIVKTWGSNAPSVHFQCRRHVCWMREQKRGFLAFSGCRSNIFDPAHHNGSNAVGKHVDFKPVFDGRTLTAAWTQPQIENRNLIRFRFSMRKKMLRPTLTALGVHISDPDAEEGLRRRT